MSEFDVDSEILRGINILEEIRIQSKNICNSVQNVTQSQQKKKHLANLGLSLLEVKNHTFISYLFNLILVALLKLTGKSLEGNSVIDRLVELRVVLERMRPLEHKLQYQIDKYVKIAAAGTMCTDAATAVKGSLDNIEDSEDENEAQEGQDADNLYKVPKISMMPYPEQSTAEQNNAIRRRKRELQYLEDALEDQMDNPEVIHNAAHLNKKAVETRVMIRKYEEDNFLRLPLTKDMKKTLGQMTTPGNIAKDVLSFKASSVIKDTTESGKKKKKKEHGPWWLKKVMKKKTMKKKKRLR